MRPDYQGECAYGLPPTIDEMRSRWAALCNAPKVGGFVLAHNVITRERLRNHYAMRESQMVEGRGKWVRNRRSWTWVPNCDDVTERQLQEHRASYADPFAEVEEDIANA